MTINKLGWVKAAVYIRQHKLRDLAQSLDISPAALSRFITDFAPAPYSLAGKIIKVFEQWDAADPRQTGRAA